MSYYVYIVTNNKHGTFYTGVTNDLKRRIYEHKEALIEGFTKKHHLKRLVYYEMLDDINEAIRREKRIKRWPRGYKINTVNENNPHWRDLYDSL